MSDISSLRNFGILRKSLPVELHQDFKIECDNINKDTPVFISGLSGLGIPKHYHISSENFTKLENFVLSMFYEYDNEYRISNKVKLFDTPLTYKLFNSWINVQNKTEFLPMHTHDGIVSFVIWMKIPFDVEEELKYGNNETSTFSFLYQSITGDPMFQALRIDNTWEGTAMMFPSKLPHCVYPFYTSDESRISISGNISFKLSQT
jgi:hypothetical protein